MQHQSIQIDPLPIQYQKQMKSEGLSSEEMNSQIHHLKLEQISEIKSEESAAPKEKFNKKLISNLYAIQLFKDSENGKKWFEKLEQLNNIDNIKHWMLKAIQYFKKKMPNQNCISPSELNLNKQKKNKFLFFNKYAQIQRLYYLTFRKITEDKLLFIVRSTAGEVLLFQEAKIWKKLVVLKSFCQLINKNSLIIVYDNIDTPNFFFNRHTISKSTLKVNLLYVYDSQEFTDQANAGGDSNLQIIMKQNGPAMLFSNRAIKVFGIQFLMDHFEKLKIFQSKQIQIFELQYQVFLFQRCYQYDFTYLNYLNQKKATEGLSQFIGLLQSSIKYQTKLIEIKQKYQAYHWPNEIKATCKNSCYYCTANKTEIFCTGCFQIWKQKIYLCYGDCYYEYHQRLHQRWLNCKNGIVQIHKEKKEYAQINQYEQKINELNETIDMLIKKQLKSVNMPTFETTLKFMNYFQSQIVSSLNNIAKIQLQGTAL